LLDVYARVSRVSTTSMVFDFEVYKSGENQLVASTSSLYVFISPEMHLPIRVPDELCKRPGRFEGKDFRDTS
jgi:acyl-CoA thioesterase FadM